jgi:hypothetical protein
LTGTRLQDRTVAEMAGQLGITCSCAKKRRQRAELAIRNALSVEAP